jgi:hypothetical protein
MTARDVMSALPQRLATKIVVDASECWLWTGIIRPDGYVRVHTGSKRDRTARNVYLHRLVYELLVGPITRRHCCNPAHLEPVTRKTNVLRSEAPSAHHARRTRCANGHLFDGHDGRQRTCSICLAEAKRRYRLRQIEAV